MADLRELVKILENAVLQGNLAEVQKITQQININSLDNIPEKLFILAIKSGNVDVLAYISTNYPPQTYQSEAKYNDLPFAILQLPIESRRQILNWIDKNKQAELNDLALTGEHLNAMQGIYDNTYHDALDEFGASPFCYYFIASELSSLLTFRHQLNEKKQLLINQHFSTDTFTAGANYLLLRLNRGSEETKLLEILLADNSNFTITSDAKFESSGHLEENISVSWYLAYYGKFDLLRKYIKCQQGVIDLNMGPVNEKNSNCGVSLAWLLAERGEWDLLADIVNLHSQYFINLNAGPIHRDDDTLKILLIKAEKFELLRKLRPLSIIENIPQLHTAIERNDLLKIRYCLAVLSIDPNEYTKERNTNGLIYRDDSYHISQKLPLPIMREMMVKYGMGIDIKEGKLVEREDFFELSAKNRKQHFEFILKHLEQQHAVYNLSEECLTNIKLAIGEISETDKSIFAENGHTNLMKLEPILSSRYCYLSGIDFIQKAAEKFIYYLKESLLSPNPVVTERAWKIFIDLVYLGRHEIINELIVSPKLKKLTIQDNKLVDLLLKDINLFHDILKQTHWITNANMKLEGGGDILHKILTLYFTQCSPVVLSLLNCHQGPLDISYTSKSGGWSGTSTAWLLFQLNDLKINKLLLKKLEDVKEKVDLLTASSLNMSTGRQAILWLAHNNQWELLSVCLNLMPDDESTKLIDLFNRYPETLSLFEQLLKFKKWSILKTILKTYVVRKVSHNAFSPWASGNGLASTPLFSSPFTKDQAEIIRDLVKLLPKASNVELTVGPKANSPSLLSCCIQQQLWDVIESLLPYHRGVISLPQTNPSVNALKEFAVTTYKKIIEHNNQYEDMLIENNSILDPLEFLKQGDLNNFKRTVSTLIPDSTKLHYLRHAISHEHLKFIKYLLQDLNAPLTDGTTPHLIFVIYMYSSDIKRAVILNYLWTSHRKKLDELDISREFIDAEKEDWVKTDPMPIDSLGLTPLHYHILASHRNNLSTRAGLFSYLPGVITAPADKEVLLEGIDIWHVCLLAGRKDIIEEQYNKIQEVTEESVYSNYKVACYGMSLAYELAHGQHWSLLQKYNDYSRVVTKLNRGLLHVHHKEYGMTLAWLLARAKQWKILTRLVKRDLSYINLFARPINQDGPMLRQFLIDEKQEKLLKILDDRFYQRIKKDEISTLFLEREGITNDENQKIALLKFNNAINTLNPEEKNFRPVHILLFAIQQGNEEVFKLLATKYQALKGLDSNIILSELGKTDYKVCHSLLTWLLRTEKYKEMSGVTGADIRETLNGSINIKLPKENKFTPISFIANFDYGTEADKTEFYQRLREGLFARQPEIIDYIRCLIMERRCSLLHELFATCPAVASFDPEELLGTHFRSLFPIMLQSIYQQEKPDSKLSNLIVTKLIETRKKINCFESVHLPFIVMLIRADHITLIKKLVSLLTDKDEIDLNTEIRIDDVKSTSLIIELVNHRSLLEYMLRYHKGIIQLPINLNNLKKVNVGFIKIEKMILKHNLRFEDRFTKKNIQEKKLYQNGFSYLASLILEKDLSLIQKAVGSAKARLSNDDIANLIMIAISRQDLTIIQFLMNVFQVDFSRSPIYSGLCYELCKIEEKQRIMIVQWLLDEKCNELLAAGITAEHLKTIAGQYSLTMHKRPDRLGLTAKHYAFLTNQVRPTTEEFYETIKRGSYNDRSFHSLLAEVGQLEELPIDKNNESFSSKMIFDLIQLIWHLAKYKRWGLIANLLLNAKDLIIYFNKSQDRMSQDCGRSLIYLLAENSQWDLLRDFILLAQARGDKINLMAKPIYTNMPTLRTLLRQGGQADLLEQLEKTARKDLDDTPSLNHKNLSEAIAENNLPLVRYYLSSSKIGECSLEVLSSLLPQVIRLGYVDLLDELVTIYGIPLIGTRLLTNLCLVPKNDKQQLIDWFLAEERYRKADSQFRIESLQAMTRKIEFQRLAEMTGEYYEDKSGYVPLCYLYGVIQQVESQALIKKANDYLISALEANNEISVKILEILIVCHQDKYLIDLLTAKPGLVTLNSTFQVKGKTVNILDLILKEANWELFSYFLETDKNIDLNLIIQDSKLTNVSLFNYLIYCNAPEFVLHACINHRPTLTTMLFEKNQYALFIAIWDVTTQAGKISFISNPMNLKLLITNGFFDHISEFLQQLLQQNIVVSLALDDNSITLILEAKRLDVAKNIIHFLPATETARLKKALDDEEKLVEKFKQAVPQNIASSKLKQVVKLPHPETSHEKIEDNIPEEKQPISVLLKKRFDEQSTIICTQLSPDNSADITIEFTSKDNTKESLLSFISVLNKCQMKVSKNFQGNAFKLSLKAGVLKSLLTNGRFKDELNKLNNSTKDLNEKKQDSQPFLHIPDGSIAGHKKDPARILDLSEIEQGTWARILCATLAHELKVEWDKTNKAFIISLNAKELTVHPYNFDSEKSLLKQLEHYQILDDSFVRNELFSRAVAELNEKGKDYGYAEITKEGTLRFFAYSAIRGQVFSQLHRNIYARMQKIASVKRMEVAPVEVAKPKEEVRSVPTVTMLQPLNEKVVKELLEKIAKREFHFLSPCKGSSKKPHILTLGFQYKGREKLSYGNDLYDSHLFFSAMRNTLNKIVPNFVEVFPNEDTQFSPHEDMIVKIIFRNSIVKDPNNNNLLAGEEAIAYLNAFNDLPTRFERELKMLRANKEEENDDNLDVIVLKKEKEATSPKVEQGEKLKDTVVILSTRREVNLQFHCERLRRIQKKIAEERVGENNNTKQYIYYLAYFLHLLRLCQQLGCARNNFKDSFYQLRNVIRHDFLKLVKHNSSRAADYADLYDRLSPTIEKLNGIFLSEINKAASIRIFAANQSNFQQCVDDFNAQLAPFQKQIDQKNLGKMPIARRIALIEQYAEKISLMAASPVIDKEDQEDATIMLHILRGSLMPSTQAKKGEEPAEALLGALESISEEEENEIKKNIPDDDESRRVYETFHSNLDTPHAEILAQLKAQNEPKLSYAAQRCF